MALTLGDNFSYQGAKPLDARLKYETVAAMKAVADATMYDGCLAYCAGTDKTYQWKSGNTVDETTGKWREFTSGGGGETYTAGDGIDISGENVISTEKSEAGWMDEVIEKVPMSGALVNIANAFNRSDLYSTTERVVGQWIDGKPLYQKTFEFTPSSYGSGSEYHIPSSVTGLTNYVPVGFELWDVWSECINNGVVSVRTSDYVLILKNDTIPYPSIKHRMTLRYIKATDQVVSIGEANEYSTSEKVVGTWIDGKPLYQKVVEFTITNSNAWTDYNHGISNIDKCVSMDCFAIYNNELYTVGPKHNESFMSGFFGKTSVSVSSKNYSNYTARCILRYTKTT